MSTPEERPATQAEINALKLAGIEKLSRFFKQYNDILPKTDQYSSWILNEQQIHNFAESIMLAELEKAGYHLRTWAGEVSTLKISLEESMKDLKPEECRHYWCSWLSKRFGLPDPPSTSPRPIKKLQSTRLLRAQAAAASSPSSLSLSKSDPLAQRKASLKSDFQGPQNGTKALEPSLSYVVEGSDVTALNLSYRIHMSRLLLRLDDEMKSFPQFSPWVISAAPNRLAVVLNHESNEAMDGWEGDLEDLKVRFQGSIDYQKEWLTNWSEKQCRNWCRTFYKDYPDCGFPAKTPDLEPKQPPPDKTIKGQNLTGTALNTAHTTQNSSMVFAPLSHVSQQVPSCTPSASIEQGINQTRKLQQHKHQATSTGTIAQEVSEMERNPTLPERMSPKPSPYSLSSTEIETIETLVLDQLRIPAQVVSSEGGMVSLQISLQDIELLKHIKKHERLVHSINTGANDSLDALLDRMKAKTYGLQNVQELHRDNKDLIDCLTAMTKQPEATSQEQSHLEGRALVEDLIQQRASSQPAPDPIAEDLTGTQSAEKIMDAGDRGFSLHPNEFPKLIEPIEHETLPEEGVVRTSEARKSRDEPVVVIKGGKLHLSKKFRIIRDNVPLVIDAIRSCLQPLPSSCNDIMHTASCLTEVLLFKQMLEHEWSKENALPLELLQAARLIVGHIRCVLGASGWENQESFGQVVTAARLCFETIANYLGDTSTDHCPGVKAVAQFLGDLPFGQETRALDTLNLMIKFFNTTPPGWRKDDFREYAREAQRKYIGHLNEMLPKIQIGQKCLKDYLASLERLSAHINTKPLRKLCKTEHRCLNRDFGQIKRFFYDQDIDIFDDITFAFPVQAQTAKSAGNNKQPPHMAEVRNNSASEPGEIRKL